MKSGLSIALYAAALALPTQVAVTPSVALKLYKSSAPSSMQLEVVHGTPVEEDKVTPQSRGLLILPSDGSESKQEMEVVELESAHVSMTSSPNNDLSSAEREQHYQKWRATQQRLIEDQERASRSTTSRYGEWVARKWSRFLDKFSSIFLFRILPLCGIVMVVLIVVLLATGNAGSGQESSPSS